MDALTNSNGCSNGVNASNIALEAPQALFNPPVESVQEIRLQSNTYSAEFGNSSAGVILTTTKSGTNQLKGSAYKYFRTEKLHARNFFLTTRPPLRWNVFGYTLGGPVAIPKLYNGKNKTFFFTSLEWPPPPSRLHRPRTAKLRLVLAEELSVPKPVQRPVPFREFQHTEQG